MKPDPYCSYCSTVPCAIHDGTYKLRTARPIEMTVRDWFAVNAPKDKWSWFKPYMVTPEPDKKPVEFIEKCNGFEWSATRYSDEYNAWCNEYKKQEEIQWPYFYADQMIKERYLDYGK